MSNQLNRVLLAALCMVMSACGGGDAPSKAESGEGAAAATPLSGQPPQSASPSPGMVQTAPGTVKVLALSSLTALHDEGTQREPVASFVRSDGVVVTRIGDRGRDRHAKDIGVYSLTDPTKSDHYDHFLAHYWEYRTARIQLEDHVPVGRSLIRATFITEAELGAREFRVWFWGQSTTGQFHFNPQKQEQKVNPNTMATGHRARQPFCSKTCPASSRPSEGRFMPSAHEPSPPPRAGLRRPCRTRPGARPPPRLAAPVRPTRRRGGRGGS